VSGPLLIAVVVLGLTAGLIITRDSLVGRPAGSRLVALLLGVDTGIVLVGGIALAAAAGRSWQLLGDPANAGAHPVIDVSRLDGDGNLYALLVVGIGLLTLLGATLLGTAARCVQGDQAGDHAVVTTVLWAEVAAAGYCVVRLLLGADSRPFLLVAVHLPFSIAALGLQHRRRVAASAAPERIPAMPAGVTPPPADQATLDLAVRLLREAGELTLRWFRADDLEVERKGDGTPVTAADRAAERFLRERLAEAFPDDGVLGEEEPPTESRSGRRWIIDPIDGTKAFTCGVPLYSNLLALEDEHGIAIGVVNLPALGETVWAGRGLGCWSERGPARVAGTTSLRGAFVMTSSLTTWTPEQIAAVEAAGAHLRTWGDGYGYALVATGRAAAMVDPIVAPYDVGPMPVLLAEAGGRFTDLGGADTIEGGSGLASTGPIHDELLAAFAGRRSA
jgi:histidinol phosphatase-like enzyme (inositol monophosphatase family)